ncbi:hypothetical protein HK101_004662 [Irineochytrium annulatum]|nr:hypothetical protein HK101_004662 [Irineochytrium annulatum]
MRSRARRGLATLAVQERPSVTRHAAIPSKPENLAHSSFVMGRFEGDSLQGFSKQIQDILRQPVKNTDVEICPDSGYLYLKKTRYHAILNEAFGPAWSLHPTSDFHLTPDKSTLQRVYTLTFKDRFLSEAVGDRSLKIAREQAKLLPESSRMGLDESTLADRCAESFVAYSALVRVCKDLGVGWQLWEKAFVDGLRKKLGCSQSWDKESKRMVFKGVKPDMVVGRCFLPGMEESVKEIEARKKAKREAEEAGVDGMTLMSVTGEKAVVAEAMM